MTHLPEILPDRCVRNLVRDFFERRKTFMSIAETHGTPAYVVEPSVLKARAEQFRSAFSSYLPDAGFYYAMKSNNLPYISGVLLDQGFGLDVSSGMELSAALKLGAEDIIFSGPGKTADELRLALKNRQRVVLLLDSAGELTRLIPMAAECRPSLRVGIRVNVNPEGLWRKFGVMADDLPEMFRQIRACPGLSFSGLQFHSSWNLDPGRQVEAIRFLGQTMNALPQEMINALAFVDIGGGYWPSQGEWLVSDQPLEHTYHRAESIERFASDISRAVKEWIFPVKSCRICFEPGRWICNDAMHLLIRVVDRKAPDLVITDGGTNAVGWERFETDYFPVLNLSRPSLDERPCHVLGALCTPHDVWGYAVHGEDVGEGDVLLIPNQGAYTWSLRQAFIKPLPRTIVMDGDTPPACLDV